MKKIKTPSLFVLSATLALGATMYSTDKPHASASESNSGIVKVQSVKKLADSGSVTYSPDNTSYLLQKETDLFVVQNGVEKKIASNVAKASWKEDGKGIVFSVNPSATDQVVETGIFETDVTGQVITQIDTTEKPYRFTLDKEGNVFVPKKNGFHKIDLSKKTSNVVSNLNVDDYRISPDGQWIAVLQDTNLILLNTKNGSSSLLTDSVDWHQFADFAWNDNSKEIAYTAHTSSSHDETLFVYDVTSKKSKPVYSVTNYIFAGVNWLKNNNLIYQLLPLRSSNTQEDSIYETLPADGGAQPNILFRNGLGVRLSEDGKKLTFIRDSDPTGVTNGAFVAELNY